MTHVSEVEIDGVAVTARPDARGGLNLAHLVAPGEPAKSPGPASKPSAWKIHVDRILISHTTGTLELADGRTGSLADFTLNAGARLDGQRVQATIAALSSSGTWEGEDYAASLSDGSVVFRAFRDRGATGHAAGHRPVSWKGRRSTFISTRTVLASGSERCSI